MAASKLSTTRLALDNCRGHLVPLLSLPDLSAHPALSDILARYTLRRAALCVLIRHVCVSAYYCCVFVSSYCACYYIYVLLLLSDMLARYTLRMLILSILRVLLYMCVLCVYMCPRCFRAPE